jgi:hypothetical protein
MLLCCVKLAENATWTVGAPLVLVSALVQWLATEGTRPTVDRR